MKKTETEQSMQDVMNDDAAKKESIRKENKKALKKFIPSVIAATILGGIAGGLIMYFDMPHLITKTGNLAGEISQFIGYCGVIVTALIGCIYPRVIYKSCKNEYERCLCVMKSAQAAGSTDGEHNMESAGSAVDGQTVKTVSCFDENELDEETVYKIEKKLSDAMQVLSVMTILQMMFYGMGICNVAQTAENHWPLQIAVTVIFILGIYLTIKNQQLLVDLTKIINPSLEGSVYDAKFQEKWEESCDEMAKLFIYKSSYKAYLAASKACIVLWIVAAFLGMNFGTGPLPIIFVSIIWLVLVMAYCNEAKKLDKR